MSREKQIEEMAQIIAKNIYGAEQNADFAPNAKNASKELYAIGYRKQSEGEWKQKEFWKGDGTWRCSECGRQIMFLRGTPKTENMYFCPGCGAKMKGGE